MTKKHQTISSERFIRIKFISFYQVFCSQVSEINRSNATNRHFDWTVNNLFCSQSVSLQLQQTSNVSFALTDNSVSSIFDNKQNRQCIRRFQHRMQFSTFHREWRCSQLAATNFRNRQLSACIWPFHDRMQQSDINRQPSVHLMTLTSDAVLATFSNNRQRAFDRFTIECSSLTIKQLRQCIWSFEVRCSLFNIKQHRQCI